MIKSLDRYRIQVEQRRDPASGYIISQYVVQEFIPDKFGIFTDTPAHWVDSTFVMGYHKKKPVADRHAFASEEEAQGFIERMLKDLEPDTIIPYKKPKKEGKCDKKKCCTKLHK